jgi:hypothetical protein
MRTERGPTLLAVARAAIAEALGATAPEYAEPGWLTEPGATFITLTHKGELRGCMGSLVAERPLRTDVQANARAAAFEDPRFAPLSASEYGEIRVEVSLLAPLERVRVASEAHALGVLRPGIDGVLLEYGWRRATFLPQVWEQLPRPETFLAHLKRKAGLPVDFWADEIRISRYRVDKWSEPEPK